MNLFLKKHVLTVISLKTHIELTPDILYSNFSIVWKKIKFEKEVKTNQTEILLDSNENTNYWFESCFVYSK